MCGFTGFYELKNARSRSEMQVSGKAMTNTLISRGPDSDGLWLDKDVPLLLGHRRLSILDLSDEGRQPMQSQSQRYVIAFNGEIYNHLDLRKPLEAAGIVFRGRSDTETLLAAIEHWGLNQALQKIIGMFAFSLWDKQERQLHFVRDRLGKKPLYVGWAGDALVFGSELKALRAHPDFEARVNRKSLSGYMRFGYCSAPECIYDGVWMLPAGQRLSVNIATLERAENLSASMIAYWDHTRVLSEAKARPITGLESEREIVDGFETLLERCVGDRLISDVPLGAFLSGGIDSSSIVAMMQKQSSHAVKTYSIGFHEAGFDEAVYAKEIAAHLGTDHHEMYISAADALNVIPSLPSMYDEPFSDISAIPTYLVSKFARESVSVALSGDGGDEMLGGYARHIEGPRIWNKARYIPAPLRKALGAGISGVHTQIWDKLNPAHPQFGSRMHKMANMLSQNSREGVYESLLADWQKSPVLGGGNDNHLNLAAHDDLKFGEAMMAWDAQGYLPNGILTKVDRASMAVSLEARAPLLDSRIYEYVWRLPAHYKIRDGKGKWLLREVLKRHVPTAMFERPKQGFNIPVGDWLRGDLRDWAEDLLSADTLKAHGLLDAGLIRKVWDTHQNGQGNHANALWSVLMFQAWHKKWM